MKWMKWLFCLELASSFVLFNRQPLFQFLIRRHGGSFVHPIQSYLSVSQSNAVTFESFVGDKSIFNRKFNATVMSVHNFGVFANLDDNGIQGFIPASKSPVTEQPNNSSKVTLSKGDKIVVNILEIKNDTKRVILAERPPVLDLDDLMSVPTDLWLFGIVQKSTKHGLFVRPAGYNSLGLLHWSNIPPSLLELVNERAGGESSSTATELESLFGEGDVVKVRILAVNSATGRLNLTMLPVPSLDMSPDSDVEEPTRGGDERHRLRVDISSLPEVEDCSAFRRPRRQDLLLWWRGRKFEPVAVPVKEVDEELAILNESEEFVQGRWRNQVEALMQENAESASTRTKSLQLNSLEKEIGPLKGLQEKMGNLVGYGSAGVFNKFGMFIASSPDIPDEWKKNNTFFQSLEMHRKKRDSILRAGTAFDRAELEALAKAYPGPRGTASGAGMDVGVEQQGGKRAKGADKAVNGEGGAGGSGTTATAKTDAEVDTKAKGKSKATAEKATVAKATAAAGSKAGGGKNTKKA